MKKRKLKLYVFKDFARDWTGGLAVAIARDEADAKAQITKMMGDHNSWGTVSAHRLDRRAAFAVYGGG